MMEKQASHESGYSTCSADTSDLSDSNINKRETKESEKLTPESESASACDDRESNDSCIIFEVDTSSPSDHDEPSTNKFDLPSSEHDFQITNGINSDTVGSDKVDYMPESAVIREFCPELEEIFSHHLLKLSAQLYSKYLIEGNVHKETNELTGMSDLMKASRVLSAVELKLKFSPPCVLYSFIEILAKCGMKDLAEKMKQSYDSRGDGPSGQMFKEERYFSSSGATSSSGLMITNKQLLCIAVCTFVFCYVIILSHVCMYMYFCTY